VGRFRRNHWVPVLQAADLDDLNRQLLVACREDEARTSAGRVQSVGAGMLIEQAHLQPLAPEPFDLVEVSFPVVSTLGCVRVKTNAYSVPVKAGTTVQVKLSAPTVEIWQAGTCVARHERCYGRHQEILDLEHYLAVLEHKPGAFAGSTALEQWRRRGRWPASYDRFWQGLMERQGRHAGTKALIGLLQAARRHRDGALQQAIETALALGCTDSAAVHHLLSTQALERTPPEVIEVGRLAQFERPMPAVTAYDDLLTAAVSS
jgi:hypothetical protein